MTDSDTVPRPEFLKLGELYKAELEPWLQSQEGRRRQARLLRWLIIGGGFALLAPLCFYVLSTEIGGFAFILLIISGVIIIAVGNLPVSRLTADVKAFVMEKLAGHFGFAYTAAPDLPDMPYFTDLQMLPSHDKRKFEDGIDGTIKGVPFRMAEVHLTQRRKSGKNHKDVTVFRGLLLCLPHAPTGEDAVAVWRREEGQWATGDGWGEVSVGDADFDGPFIVHSDSKETARRLLDPDTRRAFAKLDDHPDIPEARLGITHGRLLLAFEMGSDSFEAGKMNRPLADPTRIQQMVELFAIPFDVIDDFKLAPQPADRHAD